MRNTRTQTVKKKTRAKVNSSYSSRPLEEDRKSGVVLLAGDLTKI